MPLWIRTQNRKQLLLADGITQEGKKIVTRKEQIPLADYASEERALAVLDLLQFEIKSSTHFLHVFEMPAE